MLTPKQIKIFGAFLQTPFKEVSYKELKEYSKEKSNSLIQKAIYNFISEGIVKKRTVGNMILYSVNFENELSFSYFAIIAYEMLPFQAKKSLEIVKQELGKIYFASIAIFGSYAKGNYKKNSDLDIAIVVDSLENKKECELAAKSAELKSLLPLDIYVITKEEMLLMLKDGRENLGKQIAKNHLAIHNPTIFYSIIAEGISNGFKIEY